MLSFVLSVILVLNVLSCIVLVFEIVYSSGLKTIINVFGFLIQIITTVILYHIVIHGGFNL